MEIIAFNRPVEIDNPVQMNEDEFFQLQNIIDYKRKMLLNKQKQLKRIAKHNTFLEQIRKDYSIYNNYIVKQKQEQMAALNLLNNYISDLTRSSNLSKHNIQDAKIEQRKIVKELNSIKHGLDKIMNDVDNINNKLQT